MQKIEHIGIAVADLETAIPRWESLLGTTCYKRERVDSQKVDTAFFMVGESKIELLGPTAPDSVIATYIAKKGEGMHHIAYEVVDIIQSMKELSEQGFQLLSPEPGKGADNKLVAFFHPKTVNGVLTEICQTIRE
jgi:methylmalonyl-CoA/ethylmalonyl-CoA epimerase